MKFKISITRLALATTVVFSSSINAAVILEHSGRVLMGTEYHSNLNFVDDDLKESVYLYRITPEYVLRALDGKNTWFGSVGVNFWRASNDNIQANREDPFATIGWDRILENGLVGLTAAYTEQSSRNTQFGDTTALNQDGSSTTRSIDANWEHAFSEKWTLLTDAGYEKNKFTGTLDLTDFETKDVGAALRYKLSEKISPYGEIRTTEYKTSLATSGSDTIKYQDYLVGAVVELNPRFNFDVNAGVVDFDSSIDSEWVGEFVAEYTGGRYSLTGGLSRLVNPTGFNGLSLQDSLYADYSYQQSEKSRWGAGISLTQNSFELGSDLDTQQLRGFYDRDLSSAWLMRLELSARNQKDATRDSTDDTSLGIFFTYTSPKF